MPGGAGAYNNDRGTIGQRRFRSGGPFRVVAPARQPPSHAITPPRQADLRRPLRQRGGAGVDRVAAVTAPKSIAHDAPGIARDGCLDQ